MNCSEYICQKCPAYSNLERPCWEVAYTQCEILISIRKDCKYCKVYRLYHKLANQPMLSFWFAFHPAFHLIITLNNAEKNICRNNVVCTRGVLLLTSAIIFYSSLPISSLIGHGPTSRFSNLALAPLISLMRLSFRIGILLFSEGPLLVMGWSLWRMSFGKTPTKQEREITLTLFKRNLQSLAVLLLILGRSACLFFGQMRVHHATLLPVLVILQSVASIPSFDW